MIFFTRGKVNERIGRSLLIGLCWFSLIAANNNPQPRNTKSVAPARQEMTLNFADADIRTVIEAVSQRTGRNFIIDPRVKGKVTVISQTAMDANALYEVFLSVLKIHGYAAIPGRNATKIVPEVNAKQDAIETLASGKGLGISDAFVTQVLEIKHVDAAQLVPILRPLVPQRGHLAAYPASNVLIISDSAANISRIATIIRRIDQATGDKIEVIPLQHASATEIVRVINQLEGGAAKSKTHRSKIIADERTNSILLGGAVASRLRIRALIGHLDTPMETGGSTHVVYLRNAVAKDLVSVLTGVSKSVLAGKGKRTVSKAQGGITIQADENTNALVINAPPDVFRSLRAVIRKLDIRRAQVLVEAVIAEVSTATSTELGVQWAMDGSADNNPVGIIGFGANPTGVAGLLEDPPVAAPVSSGLNLGLGNFTGSRVGALINAIAADTSSNILSTPTLVTLDNEEAEIVVGKNVPFLTGSYASAGSTGSTNPFSTIERKDVGLTLKIKPQINEGNAVKLDVEQEVSSIADSTSGGVDLITNKRSINTSVMIEDGQILVLGGLIEDVLREKEERVPLLGDIPILGWLFRYNTMSKDKTNLMVFLRPTILKDAAFSAKVTHDKYTFLRDQQLAIMDRGVNFLDDDLSPLLPDIKDFMILPAPYQDSKTPSLNDASAPPPSLDLERE